MNRAVVFHGIVRCVALLCVWYISERGFGGDYKIYLKYEVVIRNVSLKILVSKIKGI